ncbi:MAG: hypothetical protein F6K19_03100 [Cyanothece sp. SIO1E1]|nr:hypothetical protein [Cyanothece sp. SIO1E1]
MDSRFKPFQYLAGVTQGLAGICLGASLGLGLVGCGSSDLPLPDAWSTYRNPRYGFEFPYPSDWVMSANQDGRDGQTFALQNSGVELRGWASQNLSTAKSASDDQTQSEITDAAANNFVTEQGIAGNLAVEIDSEISSIQLTLVQEKVVYSWQGISPSDQFADYYKFFDYVARRYRIPAVEE